MAFIPGVKMASIKTMEIINQQSNSLPPNSGHSQLHWTLLAVIAASIVSGLLISIEKFKTEQEILSLAEPFPRKVETAGNNKDLSLSEVEGWKTYRNEELGFEFKYPQNFLVGKFKPEVAPSRNVPPDLQKQLSDLGWNNAIVLIESEQVALFSESLKDFSVDSIPIGEVPVISIKPITTSADFYRRSYIDREFFSESKFSSDYKTKKIQIGNYQVTKLPGAPGPYGNSVYYYLLPISDNLIIEFTGHKQRFSKFSNQDIQTTESHYDQVMENIISTFKFTK